MTNTPKDKTPSEIADEILFPRETHSKLYIQLPWLNEARAKLEAAIAAERQKVFNAEHDSGIWQEKIVSLERELAEALDELIPLRMVHNAYATCCKERKELTAENEKMKQELENLRDKS